MDGLSGNYKQRLSKLLLIIEELIGNVVDESQIEFKWASFEKGFLYRMAKCGSIHNFKSKHEDWISQDLVFDKEKSIEESVRPIQTRFDDLTLSGKRKRTSCLRKTTPLNELTAALVTKYRSQGMKTIANNIETTPGNLVVLTLTAT